MEEVTLGTRGTLGCHAPTHTVKPDVNIVLKMMALYFPTMKCHSSIQSFGRSYERKPVRKINLIKILRQQYHRY